MYFETICVPERLFSCFFASYIRNVIDEDYITSSGRQITLRLAFKLAAKRRGGKRRRVSDDESGDDDQ